MRKKKECKGQPVSKLALLGAAMCVLSLALSGCQDSMQTEEEIVTPKQGKGGMEAQPEGTEEEAQGTEEAVEGAIAEQVQAPESYQWEGGDETVRVRADAPVILPQGEGFKTWKAESRVFTQEDYDRVSGVLLGSAELWDRDMEVMESSHGFTSAEIDQRIENLETKKEEYADQGVEGKIIEGGKERNLDVEIEEWRKLKENAPDEISIVEVPAAVSYVENQEYTEENVLWGVATVDGRDFTVYLDNNLMDDWRWISFEIRDKEANSNFLNIADADSAAAAELSREEIRGMAGEAMEAMGFTDFAATGEEYFTSFSGDDSSPAGEVYEDQVGYGIHFTRQLEGIPVTYTHAAGATMEDGVETSWPYENLCLVYTKDGFASFEWVDPYQIEKESDEYVFLLPWSEIQGIFEEMMVKKYSDFFADAEGVKVNFDIDEVRLGYARVIEKGNVMEGKMVPVWDFLGSETISYPDMEEPYVIDGPYESWLTINAMDGTIIDRELGY